MDTGHEEGSPSSYEVPCDTPNEEITVHVKDNVAYGTSEGMSVTDNVAYVRN